MIVRLSLTLVKRENVLNIYTTLVVDSDLKENGNGGTFFG